AEKGLTPDDLDVNGGVADDASDLFDTDEQRELEAEQAKDPNKNVEDLKDPNETETAITLLNTLADDVALDVGGRTLTKAQIAELAEKAERVEQERQVVSQAADDISKMQKFLEQDFFAHTLSIDDELQEVYQHMGQNISQAEYGALAIREKQLKNKLDDLNRRTNEKMIALDVVKKQANAKRFYDEQQELSKVIPDWDKR
ncbi:UNVERIFIED_CONTAM: hypothetical protein RF648_21015, partial [Kocuria sp. CPCC 205274]